MGRVRQVAEIAVPVVLTSATTMVLGATDTALLGHYGTAALGIVALVLPMWIVATALVIPFGSATQVVVARLHGAGDSAGIRALARAGLRATAVIGALVALGAGVAAPLLVRATAPAGLDRGQATLVLWILLCGLPFTAVTAHLRGVLGGTGDTRTGARNAVAVAVLNLVLAAVLIFPAGLGPVGSALGSTAALAAGTAGLAHRARAMLRDTGRAPLRAWLDVALPDVGFGLVSYGGDAVIAVLAAGAGAVSLAAHRMVSVAVSLVWMFVFGIGVAMAVLVGHSIGADDPGERRAVVRAGAILMLATACTTALLLALASPLVFGVLSGDPAVGAAARSVVWALPVLAPIMAVSMIYAAQLRAAGDTRGVLYASLFSVVVVALPAVWVLSAVAGLAGVYAGIVAGWIARTGATVVRWRMRFRTLPMAEPAR